MIYCLSKVHFDIYNLYNIIYIRVEAFKTSCIHITLCIWSRIKLKLNVIKYGRQTHLILTLENVQNGHRRRHPFPVSEMGRFQFNWYVKILRECIWKFIEPIEKWIKYKKIGFYTMKIAYKYPVIEIALDQCRWALKKQF